MPLFYTVLASCLGFLEIKDTLTVWFDAGQNDYLDYKNTSGGSYGNWNGHGHVGGTNGQHFHNFNSYKRASPEMKATLEFYVQYIALLKFILGIVLLITALVLPSSNTTSSNNGSINNSNNIYAIIYSNYLRGVLSLGISLGYCFHLYKLNASLQSLVVNYKQLPEGFDVAMDFIHVCVIAPLFLVASFLQFRSVYKLKSYINNKATSHYSNGNGHSKHD